MLVTCTNTKIKYHKAPNGAFFVHRGIVMLLPLSEVVRLREEKYKEFLEYVGKRINDEFLDSDEVCINYSIIKNFGLDPYDSRWQNYIRVLGYTVENDRSCSWIKISGW